jgi:hypothetical protein
MQVVYFQMLTDSQFPEVLCILRVEGNLKHLPPEELSVGELFEYQRRLAESHDLNERLKTLWIGALLGERLERCSDRQIGDLLSMVQDGLGIFSPEYLVCEHGKRRLLRSTLTTGHENWQMVRDEGLELLNAETALFRAGIPHMLLPFQRDRFASNVFYVPSARRARECLLREGFRSVLHTDAALLDSQTNRAVRLIEVGREE